jgi:hypothetical protein
MSHCKLRTPSPIHFKLRTVIGIDSLYWFLKKMCRITMFKWFFLKIEISPKSIQTIRLSIPITMRNLKWIGQGVLKLERDMWNGRMDSRTLVYHNTSRLKDGRIKMLTADRRKRKRDEMRKEFRFFIPELWDFSSNCSRFFVCRAVNWEPLRQFASSFVLL